MLSSEDTPPGKANRQYKTALFVKTDVSTGPSRLPESRPTRPCSRFKVPSFLDAVLTKQLATSKAKMRDYASLLRYPPYPAEINPYLVPPMPPTPTDSPWSSIIVQPANVEPVVVKPAVLRPTAEWIMESAFPALKNAGYLWESNHITC